MYSKEGQYLDDCLQSGFRWPKKRKRGLWHRGRYYRNPSLRSKRFRRPRVYVRSKHFRFLAARKLGRAQKKWEKGQEKGLKRTLALKPHDCEKPVRQRTSIKSGKLIWAWPTSTQLTVSLQLENFDVHVWLWKTAVRWLQISGTFGKLSLSTWTVAWESFGAAV